ncbi:MAG: metallophosphoesterase [Simkaniaceae bacterium]|nr:metallophosphoesterase [Simkaniaceae bacterium]
MKEKPRRIAHISDLHFSKLSFHIGQIFSKRIIGTLNSLFCRNKAYLNERPFALLDIFEKKQVTDVIISGDLSTTSFEKEFQIAKTFISKLEKLGIRVRVIPGNHDHYTRKAYRKKLFYDYFPKSFAKTCPYNLKDHGVTSTPLWENWTLVALDTALATSPYYSTGEFSKTTENNLHALLKTLPKNHKILLLNHFPFFQQDSPRRRLKRGDALRDLIEKNPNIEIYMHGHTHRHSVADLRKNHLPIIIDSGSTSYKTGSWNLLDLKENSCDVEVFNWEESWKSQTTHTFTWES